MGEKNTQLHGDRKYTNTQWYCISCANTQWYCMTREYTMILYDARIHDDTVWRANTHRYCITCRAQPREQQTRIQRQTYISAFEWKRQHKPIKAKDKSTKRERDPHGITESGSSMAISGVLFLNRIYIEYNTRNFHPKYKITKQYKWKK